MRRLKWHPLIYYTDTPYVTLHSDNRFDCVKNYLICGGLFYQDNEEAKMQRSAALYKRLNYNGESRCIAPNTNSVLLLARFLIIDSLLRKVVAVMYPFNKVQQDDQSWRLELDGICIVTESFFIDEDEHWLRNPNKAIAFFTIDGNLYGLSNVVNSIPTAEGFFDAMYRQYVYFTKEAFSDRFFREYGFILTNNNWTLEMTDTLGLRNSLEFRDHDGWYYNDMIIKHQPGNIGDLMHFYTGKTGDILKRIS